jgi:glutamine synthetase
MTVHDLPLSATLDTEASAVDHATVDRVTAELVARSVRYAAITFVDVHGKPKAKMVPIDHLGHAAGGSELFTGAALDGVPQDVNEDEVAAVPDLDASMVMPWQPDVAWFPSSLELHGEPFEACSRQILQRAVAKASALGYTFNLGIETEFFLLEDGPEGPTPISDLDILDRPCYDLRGLLANLPLVDEIVTNMNQLGWGVYSFDHEDANGQFETDFGYTDAVSMADRIIFFRTMVGELARRRGFLASFMAKPFGDRTGNGGHMNMSLADLDGNNLFDDPHDPRGCGLSQLGYQFIAGVLRHAEAIVAVAAPTVNSYKRLVKRGNQSGFTWAPVFACYGNNNRTNMLRIPKGGGRVECRAADSAANPYLAAAMTLAAGLEGIADNLDPGAPHGENMYVHSDAELYAMGVRSLPGTLLEAVQAFAADPLSRTVMGDAMFDAFVAEKQAEWDSYHTHVSDWERNRYLRFL